MTASRSTLFRLDAVAFLHIRLDEIKDKCKIRWFHPSCSRMGGLNHSYDCLRVQHYVVGLNRSVSFQLVSRHVAKDTRVARTVDSRELVITRLQWMKGVQSA